MIDIANKIKSKGKGRGYFVTVEGLAVVAGISTLLMVLYITADVIGRYLFNNPVPAAFEMSRTFMAIIAFLGIAYTQLRGGHLRLGFILQRFGPRGKAIVEVLSLLIGVVLFGVVTWQASIWTIESWQTKEYMEGILKIPYFPAKAGFTIGTFFAFIQFAIDFVQRILKRNIQTGGQNNEP